jgi:hypothetical protein
MAELDITNVVNISVSASPTGIGAYNTSNIALFTGDTPLDMGSDSPFVTDGYKIYLSARGVANDFASDSITLEMATNIFSQNPNILNGNGYLVIIPFSSGSETLKEAIQRAEGLVQFFGILNARDFINDDEKVEAAAYVQTLNKIFFAPYNLATDLDTDDTIDTMKNSRYNQTRCLCYISSLTADAKNFTAAYAGRALSVNFSGSNTTITMHLKDLTGITADTNMTQTLLNKAQAVGADVYVNIAGVAKVFTSGANKFFDQIYNRQWFVGALEVNLFNALATVSTKIPQTEPGMSILKGVVREACERAVRNGYIAAGAWNGTDRIGNPEDMLRNIEEIGYYLYSLPVNQQSQAERATRTAPLMQLAIKEAGAIHKTNLIVYINA